MMKSEIKDKEIKDFVADLKITTYKLNDALQSGDKNTIFELSSQLARNAHYLMCLIHRQEVRKNGSK